MSGERRVGVVAATLPQAEALIEALGLPNAVPLSRRRGARGLVLGALVLDESALPLPERAYDELIPALLPDRCAHVYELRRHSGPPPF
ncbi:hypothetical protein SEA_NIKLAS_3 [Mycobacterium Phage Niklas]|uniref:Uncharacterized protein n=1 Tax=Mycobacterium Phage Niklas TaxID=2517936 RepID=A0A482JJ81_9CAUD|nr:hypothetical protein I5H04_gp03 [Mycobacterium Phage Niklas]ASR85888.1 hypothetical protein SEA_PEANAM_3 [Mycobacterium phage Peanam]QAY02735.1 hypothetical protein SEA_SHAOBING_3 [Mycobacterium phage Shaobing]QBP31586.1 hypothetical protein SEA_NIKLAS_3 [Mycobacterium Phage Niklas]